MNVGDILRRSTKRYPDKVALVFEESRFSFKELNCRVNKLANALLQFGMCKGDRIAVLSENCNQCVETFHAAAKTGMVMAMVNPHLSSHDICYLINNAKATMVIVADEYKELIQSLRSQLPSVKDIIVIGLPWKEMKGYEEFISASSPEEPKDVAITESDLVYLPLTGGTTGIPKQVMCTHPAIMAMAFDELLLFNVNSEDIYLQACPPHWGRFVPWSTTTFFRLGIPAVLTRELKLEHVLQAIDRERVTITSLPSFFVSSMLTYPNLDQYDLTSLRSVCLTGAPLAPATMKAAVNKMGKIFSIAYAITEAPCITFLSPEEMIFEGSPQELRRLQSCGRQATLFSADIRIVDDEGKDVASGETGEIIVRSDSMMNGYLNMPEVTNEALKGGYFYSGDLATMDEQGYMYVLERKKDAIVSGGKTIASSDVESAIYSHPSVLEAAVIGIPYAKLGQAVMAVVVLKEGEEATADDIIETCAKSLPPYAVPKLVEFTGKLPRNLAGKVLKHVLRQKYSSEAR